MDVMKVIDQESHLNEQRPRTESTLRSWKSRVADLVDTFKENEDRRAKAEDNDPFMKFGPAISSFVRFLRQLLLIFLFISLLAIF